MPCGQIIPRNTDRWLIRLYKGRDPATGKRRYINKTVRGDRRGAEAELAALLAQIPPRPSASSQLDEYLDWWLYAAVDGRLGSKTASDYRALLNRYVRPQLGRSRLDRVRPLKIKSLLLGMRRRGLSPRTVRYTHAVLRSALNQARRWKLLTQNPAIEMPLPRAERNEFRVFTPEEAQRFAAACREDSKALLFLIALTTGLRPSEYLALRGGDFDPVRSTLTITRTVERSKGSWKFAETKRPRGRRTVALPEEVADLLRARMASDDLEADRLLFRSSTQGPLHERNLVQRVFKPLLQRSALPNIRLYDLRHSFATLALGHGVPPRIVSDQLGHASVAFTLQVYGHVLEESRSVGARRLSELLFHPAPAKKPVDREIARRKSA
jgi:integrase